jgi:hypothetical protein
MKVEPVTACGLTVVDDWDPPPHPAARSEARVKARKVGRALLSNLSRDISGSPLSANVRA